MEELKFSPWPWPDLDPLSPALSHSSLQHSTSSDTRCHVNLQTLQLATLGQTFLMHSLANYAQAQQRFQSTPRRNTTSRATVFTRMCLAAFSYLLYFTLDKHHSNLLHLQHTKCFSSLPTVFIFRTIQHYK